MRDRLEREEVEELLKRVSSRNLGKRRIGWILVELILEEVGLYFGEKRLWGDRL